MKRSWVIWTVVLVLLGGLGLTAVVMDIHREKQQIARHKARYGQGADVYLQQYFEWSTLPPEERIQNPWGQGKYGGPEIREKLIHQQKDRLRADLPDLASGTTTPPIVADVLYGPDWQQEVDKYRKRADTRDAVAVISTMSILAGLIICIGFAVHHGLQGPLSPRDETELSAKKKHKSKRGRSSVSEDDDSDAHDMISQIIASASDKTCETESLEHSRPSPSIATRNEPIGYFRNFGPGAGGTDATMNLKNTLRSQAADFKATSLSPAAENRGSALGTLMSSSPVASELTELTQEVSAIREFAAQQQDRVRQLQDGYDWGIIKRFCLRIIRCIDNLDERIKAHPSGGPDIQALLDVRDELVFSLESSGVEQFEPPTLSDYKGLEKNAEAVKAREPAPSADLVGKIASVVRPGYRYVVGEDDVKIVRCAQVKLYGECSCKK